MNEPCDDRSRAPLPVVLVVDDDLALREVLSSVLRDERFVVATACDGQQALDLLHAGFRPSVILLDLWMPNVDGQETLELLKNDPRVADIPVIVVTADPRAPKNGALKPADALIMKPLDLDVLLDNVVEHSRRYTRSQQLS